MAVKQANVGMLFVRLLGLLGICVAAVSAVVWYAFQNDRPALASDAQIAIWVGLGVCGLALLFELPRFFGMITSRRGAVGGSVALQVAIAVALVVGANYFSFERFKRFDLTWDHAFTLSPEIRSQLSQLHDETEIFVVQRNLFSGITTDKAPDRYDIKSAKKIIEKITDLADEFGDLGGRFKVKVFDIQDDDYDERIDELKEAENKANAEAAAKAEAKKEKFAPPASVADLIRNAEDNAIFIRSGDKVQRLAFQDIYQVDKKASATANGKKGNLVLSYQGVEPFVRKILNVEEKAPRVAVAVVHPVLSTATPEEPLLTMNGAKKALDREGFLTKDILLRKQVGGGLSDDPAAITFDENRFEQIEEAMPVIEESIAEMEKAYANAKKSLDAWKNQTLTELQKTYVYIKLRNGQQGVTARSTLGELDRRKIPYETIPIDDEDQANEIKLYSRDVASLDRELAEYRQERDTLVKERAGLNVDELAEKRRIADVGSKMQRMLADADLLVIPRFTMLAFGGQMIPNKVHKLDPAQLQAVKAFLKEGKPVLFLLGPANERREAPPEFGGGEGDDGLEAMIAELGIRMPKQTILYNVEVKEFNERKSSFGFSQREIELPHVLVDWEPRAGQVNTKKAVPEAAHPIRVSLGGLANSLGDKLMKELQIRDSRPVYVELDGESPGNFDAAAVFLMTGPDSWNENSPFPNEKREAPRYTPTKDGDKAKGTIEEERRGPFPIGVAIEKTLPKSWFPEGKTPTKARIGVIGNGGVFVGPTLSPIKQKLLLDVSNWLLGRDDLLSKQQDTWSFPRVEMTPAQQTLWHLCTGVLLPLMFLLLGLAVWFVRRMR